MCVLNPPNRAADLGLLAFHSRQHRRQNEKAVRPSCFFTHRPTHWVIIVLLTRTQLQWHQLSRRRQTLATCHAEQHITTSCGAQTYRLRRRQPVAGVHNRGRKRAGETCTDQFPPTNILISMICSMPHACCTITLKSFSASKASSIFVDSSSAPGGFGSISLGSLRSSRV